MEDSKEKIEEDQNELSDKQMYSAISFCVMLVVVGIPLWWKTTEVYRVSLPYSEIDRLHELGIEIQTNIHVVTVDLSHGTAIIDKLKDIFKISKIYKVTFKQHSIDKALLGSSKTLEEIDSRIKHPTFPGSLQLFSVPGLSRFTPHNIILGQNRTIYFSSDTDAYELYNFLISKIFNEESLLTTISHISLPMKSETKKHARHRVPPTDELDILFTIINPEPEFLEVNFNLPKAIQEYINPFLNGLEDMNKFHVKSQWLYFVNLQIQPKFVNRTRNGPHFALSEALLPYVITPLEKKLAFHVSKFPSINFVLYIPPCSQTPLHIYTKKGYQVEGANAFISPGWGGIQIYNPDRESCINTEVNVDQDVHEIMPVFLNQLRLLLGVSESIEKGREIATIAPAYLRLWEKDVLLRSKTVEQLTLAKLNLQSLSKLLGKINNIVITDHVGDAIYLSLDYIYKATSFLSEGKLSKAYEYSKTAFLSSETAFTDPSLLALLYFPDDQKYAVYIPLFLPVMIPVLISLKHIKKWAYAKFLKSKLKND